MRKMSYLYQDEAASYRLAGEGDKRDRERARQAGRPRREGGRLGGRKAGSEEGWERGRLGARKAGSEEGWVGVRVRNQNHTIKLVVRGEEPVVWG